MAAGLAEAAAGCACGVLHYGRYVSVSGDVGVLGGSVQESFPSCGAVVVECKEYLYIYIYMSLGELYVLLNVSRLQISQHALNSLFALFEVFLPRTSPPPPLHVVFLIFLLACYLALAYITHATEGFYPYSFLDPSKGSGRVAGYCFGILIAICVIFGIVWGVIWLRNLATQRLGLAGKFMDQRRTEDMRERDVEMVEVQEEAK